MRIKKFLPYILILVVLVGLFSPLAHVDAGVAEALEAAIVASVFSVIQSITFLILKLASFVLWIAGMILNFVLTYTVVDMAAHINGGVSSFTIPGLSGQIPPLTGINTAWKVIRDLMNIAFIFLLVYEGIKIIIGQSDTGKAKTFISGVVLASLLINFSLFFTKAMIDASNIVTIGLYNSIIDDTQTVSTPTAGTGTAPQYRPLSGLSVPYMNALGVTDIFSTNSFSAAQAGSDLNLIILHLLGTVVFIIVSFAFFAVAAMFVIRYVTLIFLLMLSPLAFMGLAPLPFISKYSSDWWNSLTGQLLFAPVYMIMNVVILTLMTSPGFLTSTGSWGDLFNTTNNSAQNGAIGLIFNFVVVIGFIILSLIVSKDAAQKGSALIGQATGSLTKFAGNTFMGGGGALLRNTAGRWASKQSVEELETRVAKSPLLSFKGLGARTRLATAKGSFDIRRSGVGEVIADQTKVDFGKGIPFSPKAGQGGMAAAKAEVKKSGSLFSTSKGEENLDKILKSYTDKRDWNGLRDYIRNVNEVNITEKDAQYMYKKMNARDRISLDNAIKDQAYVSKLRSKLPVDEQVKVFTEAKDWEGLSTFIQTKDGKPRGEQDQADIYRSLNDKDRAALEKTTWGSSPAGKAVIDSMKSSLPFEEQIKVYRNQKDWVSLAAFMRAGKTPSQQQYIYESLSVPDRIAFEKGGLLTPTEIRDLRDGLSVEEQDKTKEAERKANKAAANERAVQLVNDIATGTINPATGVPYTPAEIKVAVNRMPDTAARYMSSASRMDPNITMHLRTKQLADLMANGDPELTNAEAVAIKANIDAAYPPNHPVVKWLNDPIRVADWS